MIILHCLFAATIFLHSVQGHMGVRYPCPRASPFCDSGYGFKNYDMDAPYNYKPEPALDGRYPCREQDAGDPTASFYAGQTIPFRIQGTDNHQGGHCQFALSYDNGHTWAVLRTVLEDCLTGRGGGPYHYGVHLPREAAGGPAVLSWVFFNKQGDREFYMNCIDVSLIGPRDGSVTGPDLLVAQLPGAPRIGEWMYGGDNGERLFRARPFVTISPSSYARDDSESDGEMDAFDEEDPDNLYDRSSLEGSEDLWDGFMSEDEEES